MHVHFYCCCCCRRSHCRIGYCSLNIKFNGQLNRYNVWYIVQPLTRYTDALLHRRSHLFRTKIFLNIELLVFTLMIPGFYNSFIIAGKWLCCWSRTRKNPVWDKNNWTLKSKHFVIDFLLFLKKKCRLVFFRYMQWNTEYFLVKISLFFCAIETVCCEFNLRYDIICIHLYKYEQFY